MAARIATALPRIFALMLIALASTAAAALAAQRERAAPVPQARSEPTGPALLVVPDVRGQAYVFAKGILEESGFAWTLAGRVRGYSANVVVEQAPAPGTRVVDTGQPTIVLRLARSGDQSERGTPENSSPYAGTELRPLTPIAPGDGR